MTEVETEVPAQTETPPVETEATPPEDAPLEEPAPSEPPEEAPPAPEQHGRTPEQYEQIRKKLDTSANTWRRRVEELLGDDFSALTVCELCGDDMPGFHWPAEVMRGDTDTQTRLIEVLKLPAAPEYEVASHVRTCGDCAGWGKVASGSHVPGHEIVTCPSCKGYGFVPPPGGMGTSQPTNGAVVLEGPPDETPLVQEDADIWGSPMLLESGAENPNYGKMPQYKNPALP